MLPNFTKFYWIVKSPLLFLHSFCDFLKLFCLANSVYKKMALTTGGKKIESRVENYQVTDWHILYEIYWSHKFCVE